MNHLRSIVGLAVVTSALVVSAPAGASAAGQTGTSAPAVQPAATSAASLAANSWSDHAHGEPPEYKCTINASATARLAWLRKPGKPMHLGLLVTTGADIHNPYVFVGCTIRVLVDVVDVDGVILSTVSNDAFAGAYFDPQGNNKSYTWPDEADIDVLDLSRIGHLEVRLQNVA